MKITAIETLPVRVGVDRRVGQVQDTKGFRFSSQLLVIVIRTDGGLEGLGEFNGSYSPKSVFGPNKTNGGELVHAMIWHQDCTCYRQSGPVHTGLG